MDSGSLSLAFDAEVSTAINLSTRDNISTNLTAALGEITALTGNISVLPDSSQTLFDLSFVNTLAAQNITTALTLNASGVQYARFYTTTLTLGTAGLLEAFNVAGSSSITPQMEVEIVESGKRRTVFQGQITIVGDLLAASSYNPTTYTLP